MDSGDFDSISYFATRNLGLRRIRSRLRAEEVIEVLTGE